MLQKLDECDSGDERDESEASPAKKRRVVPSAGGGDVLFQATMPQSAQVQRQGDEPGAHSPAINPAIQLPGRRETTNQAFSSKDELTPEKEESRGRHQSQNALTEAEGPTMYSKRQIQDAQTAFLCLLLAEMLIHIQGYTVAEARRFLGFRSPPGT
ncbi:hypothetical protein ILYODFUR_031253 [Ilyodon furcidens]|uniref:Uncharacterized protein n=1 Tax=Ilyodon furcidens TaxID=33524 RepID=A0ABV0V7Q2_9TELE